MILKCRNCVVKHVGQALVCWLEYENGYPEHIIKVIGHLAEAENECEDNVLRTQIRSARLRVSDGGNIDWGSLISMVLAK